MAAKSCRLRATSWRRRPGCEAGHVAGRRRGSCAFFVGGVLVVWTAWKNGHLPATLHECGQGHRLTLAASCEHHSYHWPVLLVLVGIAGLLVTGTWRRVSPSDTWAPAAVYGTAAVSPDRGPSCGWPGHGGGFPGSACRRLCAGLPPAARGRRRDRSPDNIRTRLSSFGPAKVGNAPGSARRPSRTSSASRSAKALGSRRPEHRCRSVPEHC